ncbi:MAG: hypothetical protein HYZ49_10455 [Chloroflexi bacterium]|nr:hypothetical protein [Chloroflexota bacterium]
MLFFGTKQVQRPLPNQQKVCPVCLSVTEHTVTESGTYFTLYFVWPHRPAHHHPAHRHLLHHVTLTAQVWPCWLVSLFIE